ncbi:hypothetical protein L345_16443 [Ophiophagus hannah]|uniref:Uncharacterized protein n=1 Tax=Ophiophagus hannah TaxID=8665 RepID=V8N856_OPHHA|nr:hypothetical protein L345_16443 [Ophiophagus hannah]
MQPKMASLVFCCCSAFWNFVSLFHLHIMAAREIAVLICSEPWFLCLIKSTEMQHLHVNPINIFHQPMIMWLPRHSGEKQNKNRTNTRK